ncbi:MAG TPA: ABC transporter permease subunit [Anaerolineae bacterium]|jgi:ABC-2 type transport system permease protein|nr:ABC transporter permease subunit [Anaerolineae bacterium]
MRIRTIINKEWSEVFKNRMVLMTVGLLPLLFTAIPLIQLAVTRTFDPGNMNSMPTSLALQCHLEQLSDTECLQSFLSNQFMLFFLLMPLAIPVIIASYSIVGEKITRSLEPLLATPISTSEIILGKALAASIPAIIATWGSFVIFLVVARFLVVSDRVYAGIVNPMWLVAIFLVAPLMTVLSVNVAIIISSRVSDPRTAEQLGMVVMIPLLGIFFAQIFGLIALNVTSMFLMAIAVLMLDFVLVGIGVKLFQREAILTRWK